MSSNREAGGRLKWGGAGGGYPAAKIVFLFFFSRERAAELNVPDVPNESTLPVQHRPWLPMLATMQALRGAATAALPPWIPLPTRLDNMGVQDPRYLNFYLESTGVYGGIMGMLP